YCADEILLTGTGAQLAPVIEIDHRQIGTGTLGPIATEIQQLYLKVVRAEEPDFEHWCTPCFGSAARGYAMVSTAAETKAVDSQNGHNGHNNGHTKLPASRGKVARTAKH